MNTAFNATIAQCPGCGVPLEFKIGTSRVIVCDHCRFAVARTDRGLENIGKVADLVPTGAKLTRGLEGTYEGVAFRIVGRIQYDWGQGVWDEWYTCFADGRWGWVAEAQGRYYVSFPVMACPVPPFEELKPGVRVDLAGRGSFVASDMKQARYAAAAGELPERIRIDDTKVKTADLSGPGGAFATLDYGEGNTAPDIFVGSEVPLEALHLTGEGLQGPPQAPNIKAAKLTCPRCNGPLDLKAPDSTMRVVCPHCGALLDTTQGNLKYLSTVARPKHLTLPLGKRGTIRGTEYLLIGWCRRSTHIEGATYYWEEYLLYDEKTAGYRFLVESDGHWSFVEPIGPGDVSQEHGVVWNQKRFKEFGRGTAIVSQVLGEFYWAISQGETVDYCDYVCPPDSLSEERSPDEVNWSHGVYLKESEVYRAFGHEQPKQEPRPTGMMQPNPWDAAWNNILPWSVLFTVIAIMLFLFFLIRPARQVWKEEFTPQSMGVISPSAPGAVDTAVPANDADPDGVATPPADDATADQAAASAETAANHTPTATEPWNATVHFSEPFTLEDGHRNIEVRLSSSVDNTWAFVGGALINQATYQYTEFYLESAYYSGSDSDGSWSEDDRVASTVLAAPEAGTYVVRLEAGWEPKKPPPRFSVQLNSGVARPLHFLLALVAILGFPAFVLWRRRAFEIARWEESSSGD